MGQVEHDFAHFSTGCRLLRAGEYELASREFQKGLPGGLNAALSLLSRQALERGAAPSLYESHAPLSAWNRSNFGAADLKLKCEHFAAFFEALGGLDRNPVILDIGTGDGALVGELVVRLRARGVIDEPKLVVLDKSQAMVDASTARCGRLVETVPMRADISDLSPEQLQRLRSFGVTVGLAAEVLHHIPWEGKIRTFDALSKFVPNLFLAELEGHHDREAPGSQSLLRSVWNFYEPLVRNLVKSDMSEDERIGCRNEIFLAEVVPLILEDFKNRGNYHVSGEAWLEAACAGNYCCHAEKRLEVEQGAPALYLAHLNESSSSLVATNFQ